LLTLRLQHERVVIPVLSVPVHHLESLRTGGTLILVVGQLGLREGDGPASPCRLGYHSACFAELDDRLLRETRPGLVVSPLVGDRFDAVDLATRLVELGYAGPYRAFSGPLPRPGLIRAEVRSAAPGLDFDLVIVSHGPDRPD
jgi:hypothetical protein